MHLVPHQVLDAVSRAESFGQVLSMLPDAHNEVADDADIQRAVTIAGKQVDARLAFDGHSTKTSMDSRFRGNDGRWLRRRNDERRIRRLLEPKIPDCSGNDAHASSVTRST